MSYAYTPGLKVMKTTRVRKNRILPVPGEVLVQEGIDVSYETVIARTHVPGDVHMLPLFYNLGVEPYELPRVMLKKEGDTVEKDELLGLSKSFFGLFKTEYLSEYSGTIELVSSVTGMVAIREFPVPVNLDAYISGRIIGVTPSIGVSIETKASLIQGIFGIGGERHGKLMTIAGPDEVITKNSIGNDCVDRILVGGSVVTLDAFKKAEEEGVKGIITGGIEMQELTSYLGYDIGVAITGHENVPFSCIITEGFGRINIANHTFNLLSSLEGKIASINGATQIRAGVVRPEIIVPQKDTEDIEEEEEDTLAYGMEPGTRVRVIRQPNFGAIGNVISLPIELQRVGTESSVRVMVIELDDGRQVTVARANVEIMEE
jgi:hypothetical protein